MKVDVLLADAAQADPAGKVHALGLGWTRIAPITGPMGIITLIQFNHLDELSSAHECVLQLVDENDEPVLIPTTNSEPFPLKLVSKIDIELKEDGIFPVTAPFVVNIGPGINLKPGSSYAWRVTIDGISNPAWTAKFVTNLD